MSNDYWYSKGEASRWGMIAQREEQVAEAAEAQAGYWRLTFGDAAARGDQPGMVTAAAGLLLAQDKARMAGQAAAHARAEQAAAEQEAAAVMIRESERTRRHRRAWAQAKRREQAQ